jgi:hypothetical protein
MASTLRILGGAFNKISEHNLRHINVVFDRCGNNFYPYPPKLKFNNIKNIVFDNCDKNFVFYLLTESIFPDMNNVEKIYLNSHPCDKKVFLRICRKNWDDKPTVLVDERYNDLVKSWAYFDYNRKDPIKNIVTKKSEDIKSELYHMSLESDLICDLYNTRTECIETFHIQSNDMIYKLVDDGKKNLYGYPITKYKSLNATKINKIDDYFLIEYYDGTKEKYIITY